MKPLLSVISYNMKRETTATLRALQKTGAFEQAQVVVFDNGSTDGTAEAIRGLFAEGLAPYGLVFHGRNIGCPRALNSILHHYRDAAGPRRRLGWVARSETGAQGKRGYDPLEEQSATSACGDR